ncbi:HAMP domain-containing sensor histidine kinase [Pseudomonas sp. F1_0610]|uniref:HAMP domain-containing sensor histidine kinase n=1 Tax=Pseudomonas sp. F1_0610 TaxID=3114284 RepID=UPI0039C31195
MRTLFWRVFAAFCLALVLVIGLTFAIAQIFNTEQWLLNSHPAFNRLTTTWLAYYESGDERAARALLQQRRKQFNLETQVFDINSRPVSIDNSRGHGHGMHRGRWLRITQEVSSNTGQEYLFVYRLPNEQISAWQRGNWIIPASLATIAFLVLISVSFWLTTSITRPINKLRHAVHELGQSSYQQAGLQSLTYRADELGVLARDFNAMGMRLQTTLAQQKQLLRDVSHELRSPLARLRISMALAQRAEQQQLNDMWPKLERECDRLDTLIGEILALARLDNHVEDKQLINLNLLFQHMKEDALILAPEQNIQINCDKNLTFTGCQQLLEQALNNLLNNALRFNPTNKTIEIRAFLDAGHLLIHIQDEGPGVAPELLDKLAEPFFRAPNQHAQGYGLGLAIARRAIEQHNGTLSFKNAGKGGLLAEIKLPFSAN